MHNLINRMIIPFGLWLSGISYLSAYHDNLYHRIYGLMLEVPSIILIIFFAKSFKKRNVLKTIFLCSLFAYQIYSLSQNVFKTMIYFLYFKTEYSEVERLYINPMHPNCICWYLFIAGTTFIISFFFLITHRNSNKQ